MLFNSLEFLLFFPTVILITFLIPEKCRRIWLLLASYLFYACWNYKYILLLFGVTVITYLSGRILEKAKHRKTVLTVCIICSLSILFYFKYVNFAFSTFGDFMHAFGISMEPPVYDIVLPVGISFFTFQAMGYVIDVYRREIYAERSFIQYALFVSFFPQLVAGPIERSKNLLKQLSAVPKFNYDNVRTGLLTMLWGFFVKVVISDRCAVIVNTVYDNYQDYSGIFLITANILFAVQIYCDFMGYTIIAQGAAKVLGYQLMDNFKQPYLAESIADFWRRWHVSLSTWFRDYLYFPLGGSRCGRFRSSLNLLITFLVSGLWHGADGTFVLWGGLHGFYQIVERQFRPIGERISKRLQIEKDSFGIRFFKIIWVFFLTDLAWVFFRASSVVQAVTIIQNSFRLNNIGLLLNGALYQMGLSEREVTILFLSLLILLLVSLLRERKTDPLEWLTEQPIVFRYLIYWSLMVLIILSADIGGQEFIYFQF
ncbi:MAG: MBOAT family O-acyltransferase [Eubacteriales bacterium]|nr:MBOAT family O-acyltransferase [Eubacteriales bacterium]